MTTRRLLKESKHSDKLYKCCECRRNFNSKKTIFYQNFDAELIKYGYHGLCNVCFESHRKKRHKFIKLFGEHFMLHCFVNNFHVQKIVSMIKKEEKQKNGGMLSKSGRRNMKNKIRQAVNDTNQFKIEKMVSSIKKKENYEELSKNSKRKLRIKIAKTVNEYIMKNVTCQKKDKK